jgi:HSP20 family molecular chaperone IbpA
MTMMYIKRYVIAGDLHIPLPCEVDIDGSQATLLKNGKLRIKLPKKAKAKAK